MRGLMPYISDEQTESERVMNNNNYKNEDEFVDFPYIGGHKKPCQKNKKRTPAYNEEERWNKRRITTS